MSKVSSLVLGLVSGAAMFGAIQYASGNDLRGTLTDQDKIAADAQSSNTTMSHQTVSNDLASSSVNRSAKSDRASFNAAQMDQQGQTLSFRVHGVPDTSIMVRLAGTTAPVKTEALNSRAVPTNVKPQRAAVACEPPVSVLTEVAKLLQPGRCVT